ncbi:MAG TPA: 50S ribosomal protein L16 [Candidatus Pacearchaeota archaeon]|nr:50S ribosomal protein L16 [Candidatus Pacearchaeota archaeon]HOK94046.1 50S ribosomal protein L16 [Candidatus Pacearchaeota archaeon]HPO75117.1 50S ribosomal protein L16 [Candidatus Pacearchaeota archaeon]
MLQPKRVKYRKMMKGRTKGVERRATEIAFGTFGLKAMESRWIKANQIEAARRVLLREFKGKGKIWIRIFPQKPVTFKGNEVGMGGGKGAVDHYVFPIKPGRIIFEIDGVPKEVAVEALKEAGRKLPIKTKIVETE